MRGLLPFLFLLFFFLSPIQAQPEGQEEEPEETWSEDGAQARTQDAEDSEVMGAENEARSATEHASPEVFEETCRELGGKCRYGFCPWNENRIFNCKFARPCCRKRKAIP
ncbi:defensin-B5-like [Tachyglossus aculeatus]|uniref:defensin-B5-like n=1 Tax=Tachyglossus aculeatus TaxID=9261 RepID=UPI0018F5E043|nr:defensin-B5-like [Tachyglossus aculeatus]